MGHDYPVKLGSQEKIDYGSAIPLSLLTDGLTGQSLAPISRGTKMHAYHYAFGQKLGEILKTRTEKIAIIAAGNLSHRLKKNSGAVTPV